MILEDRLFWDFLSLERVIYLVAFIDDMILMNICIVFRFLILRIYLGPNLIKFQSLKERYLD